MLTHLRIIDFALLDDVEIEFAPGFNVLTGETGAGKSLLAEAVALLRGGRASSEVIRAGAEEARIEAIFEPPHGPAADALRARLEAAGISASSDEGLIVKRVVGARGRGRVYINNSLQTAQALADTTGVLIELAGQHEHQTLGDPSEHLRLVDEFAELQPRTDEMADAYDRLQAARSAFAAVDLDEHRRAEREAFLLFQLRELDKAGLEVGEDERLQIERARLRASEKLLLASQRGEETLDSREQSVCQELGALSHELSELGAIDAELGNIGKQIEESRLSLEDAAHQLRRYAEHLESSPERLSEVEDRLDLIARLLRKHRDEAAGVAGLLSRRDLLQQDLARLQSHEETRARLAAETALRLEEAVAIAERLSTARAQAAQTLSQRVEAALSELSMNGARFVAALLPAISGPDTVAVQSRALGRAGFDRVEFQLSANRGEPLRPLHRVASGGELSRILLALKRTLSHADQVATYVFDEVDSGIGGQVADVVGRQIRAIAHHQGSQRSDKQVLCITHLPQIAVYADAHFVVEKSERDERVHTTVRRLSSSERKEEVARMLSGKITPKARAHAEELLRAAAQV